MEFIHNELNHIRLLKNIVLNTEGRTALVFRYTVSVVMTCIPIITMAEFLYEKFGFAIYGYC